MSEQPESLLEVLVPITESVPAQELPLLLAWLERMAADKYRVWAQQATDDVERKGLMDCAFREDAIAEFIEFVEPQAESTSSPGGGRTWRSKFSSPVRRSPLGCRSRAIRGIGPLRRGQFQLP